MWSWPVILVLALLIPFALGYLFPWFSAVVLGPVVLVAAGVLFVTLHRYFFPFQSDGSPAGMIVPGLLWVVLVLGCLWAVVLIATGVMRMRRTKEATLTPSSAPGPRTDAEATPGSDSSMLNVSLGVAALIAPFLPLYLLLRPFSSLLFRSLGYFGLLTVQFLLSNVATALLIYFGLRAAGLRRLFPPHAPGSKLIFAGSVAVLEFRVAQLLRFLPGKGAGSVMYTLQLMNVLVWLAWAVVLIGLFLFWKDHPGDRHHSQA